MSRVACPQSKESASIVARRWSSLSKAVGFSGFRGDTISSALTAEGVRILGRSFKYHRPRGLLSAAGHDVNAMMQVRNGGTKRAERAC